MTAATFLEHLQGVRQTGTGRWSARCPAHDDRHPSLNVRELHDGRTLIHCFAGCAVAEIVGAIGLELSDLFPERPTHRGKSERRPFPATDVLRAIEHEALIVAVAASHLGNGGELSVEDRKRLLLASSRLTAAVQESGHG